MCFTELLKFLEQDIPDPQRLELLKKIYIVAATEEKSTKESPLPVQYMQMARSLSAGELLVLFSAYRIKDIAFADSQGTFTVLLTNESQLIYGSLVFQYFERLFEKGLLKKIQPGFGNQPINKLIDPFGLAFCEYIEYYDLITA